MMTRAEVFMAFSRKESPSAADGDRAILWLKQLKGLGFPKYKEEKDCIFFLSDCFSWFTDQREAFATATAAEVENLVKERFKEYLKAVEEAAEPKVGMPWRAEPLPVEKNHSGIVKEGRIANVDYRGLKKASRVERAQDAREMKADPLVQGLKNLKRKAKRAKVYQFLLAYMERRLRYEVECQRYPELRQEALWRTRDAIQKALHKNNSK
jgi:hypothetical protein